MSFSPSISFFLTNQNEIYISLEWFLLTRCAKRTTNVLQK